MTFSVRYFCVIVSSCLLLVSRGASADPVLVTVMNVADVPEEVALRGRVNDIRRRRFPSDSGLPGVNLEFGYTLIPEGYFTPRHRHNFDQIRLTLDGVFSTGHGDLA